MRNAKDMKVMGSYGTIGLEIVLSMLLGLFVGYKLDEWLGTKPYLTVVWFFFGCAAGGRSLYRSWKQMQIAAKREEDEEGNPAQAFPDDKSLAWQREEDRLKREKDKRAADAQLSEDAADARDRIEARLEADVASAGTDSLEKGEKGANKSDSDDAGEDGAAR